jgi:hypothetical protein
MGEIICVLLEDCLFNISYDKKYNKIFKLNQKVLELVNSKIADNYELSIISNLCEEAYDDLNVTLTNHGIKYKNIFYSCNASKTLMILNEIKPDIYIDTHIELCAGLNYYGIDTYLFTESSCASNNKSVNSLKIL